MKLRFWVRPRVTLTTMDLKFLNKILVYKYSSLYKFILKLLFLSENLFLQAFKIPNFLVIFHFFRYRSSFIFWLKSDLIYMKNKCHLFRPYFNVIFIWEDHLFQILWSENMVVDAVTVQSLIRTKRPKEDFKKILHSINREYWENLLISCSFMLKLFSIYITTSISEPKAS